MKTLFISLLLVLGIISTLELKAQTFQLGTVVADAGVGFGIYGVRAYSPINKQEHSGIAGVGTSPCVDVEFGLLRLIGVGVHYRRGTYGSYSNGKIRGTDICGMINIHLANKKDKFDLIIGAGYGLSSMKTPSNLTESLIAKGGIIRIQVAPHLYFGKHIGMFFRVAYNKHLLSNNLTITESGGKTWTQADGATWNMSGPEFNLGVSFKIDVLKKKD